MQFLVLLGGIFSDARDEGPSYCRPFAADGEMIDGVCRTCFPWWTEGAGDRRIFGDASGKMATRQLE